MCWSKQVQEILRFLSRKDNKFPGVKFWTVAIFLLRNVKVFAITCCLLKHYNRISQRKYRISLGFAQLGKHTKTGQSLEVNWAIWKLDCESRLDKRIDVVNKKNFSNEVTFGNETKRATGGKRRGCCEVSGYNDNIIDVYNENFHFTRLY